MRHNVTVIMVASVPHSPLNHQSHIAVLLKPTQTCINVITYNLYIYLSLKYNY